MKKQGWSKMIPKFRTWDIEVKEMYKFETYMVGTVVKLYISCLKGESDE